MFRTRTAPLVAAELLCAAGIALVVLLLLLPLILLLLLLTLLKRLP
jgi:hypothetical protein